MALTSDRFDDVTSNKICPLKLPVKGNAIIYIGAMVQADDTGFLIPVGNPGLPAASRSVYVALERVDATGKTDGECYVECQVDGFLSFPSDAVLAQVNTGLTVYATADDTFTLVPNNAPVGRLLGPSPQSSRARILMRG